LSAVARETAAGVSPAAPAKPDRRLRPLTRLALLPILVYRRLISPLLGPRCRYYPTCSAYAEQAVRELFRSHRPSSADPHRDPQN